MPQVDKSDVKVNSLNTMLDQVMAASANITTLSRTDQLINSTGFTNLTNNRALLSNLYTEQGILQHLVDVPPDDAVRGGLDIRSPELSDDDITALQDYIEEEAILQKYAQARKWARLFGGAGLIINAGQGRLDQFDIDKIKTTTPLEFYPVDRWELMAPLSGSPVDQFKPMFKGDEPFQYYGHALHQTHVLKFKNKEAPSFIRSMYMGWGMSELERLVRSYNMFLKNNNVIYELLDEAKIDVFGITGFNSSMATSAGTKLVADRVSMAARLKNFQSALVMDSTDTYEQKQLTYSGLAEILSQVRIGIASDCRMPLTKLFGITPSGLGNNDDVENYNSMVETEIRSKDRPELNKLLKICFRKVFGFVPAFHFSFKNLRELSPIDESTVKTQKLNRILAGYTNGIITGEQAAIQINAEHIFPHPIKPNEVMSYDDLMEARQSKPAPMVPGYGAGTSVVTT